MPWTFSHPAAVFPIKQSRIGQFFDLPALIIGSISPDLFYSVGLYHISTKAHHFIGWLYTAFPLCVMIFILFSIFSDGFNKILPIPIKPYKQWNFRGYIVIAFSLFVGAATHIIWDGFTHETGSFVRNIHILQYDIFNPMTNGQEIRIYKFLQYLGSLLGLLYLCIKYWKYYCNLGLMEQTYNRQKLYKLFAIFSIASGIILPFAIQYSYKKTGFHFNNFVFNQLRLTELVFFVLILIYALWANRSKSKYF